MRARAAMKEGPRWAAVAVAVLLAIPTPCLRAAEPQVRIEVPRPFSIGARSFSPGVVRVVSLRDFTPTTAILEVWVEGECLGMIRARVAAAEAQPRRGEAILVARPDGGLLLVGYSVADGVSGRSYRFELPVEPDLPAPRSSRGGAAATASAEALGTH